MNRLALPITAAAFFTIALSSAVPMAMAQNATTTPSTQSQQAQAKQNAATKLSVEDRYFLMHAIPGGMAEVELSKLAADKAQSNKVKQFAQRMVTDHTKANDELMKLAQEKGLQPPQELGPVAQAERQHLQSLSGAQFDREYMGDQVIDHDLTIYMFERESRHGTDKAVKTFASQTIPTLREHHSMALEISGAGLTAER